MENFDIYMKSKTPPKDALRTIKGGRMSGKTDINPMWRIKQLTELFGACGIGWKYEITEKRLEKGSNDEIASFVEINLYIKTENGWSEPIPGTGGNMFVSKERNGLYTNDECFKMALTDAISVACKALGFAADVYWNEDKTKYSAQASNPQGQNDKKSDSGKLSEATLKMVRKLFKKYAELSDFTNDELTKAIIDNIGIDVTKMGTEANGIRVCSVLKQWIKELEENAG